MKKLLLVVVVAFGVGLLFFLVDSNGLIVQMKIKQAKHIELVYVVSTEKQTREVSKSVDDIDAIKHLLLTAKWSKNNSDCDCAACEYIVLDNQAIYGVISVNRNKIELLTPQGHFILIKIKGSVETIFPVEMIN